MEKPPKIGRLTQFSFKRSIAKELWDAKGNRAKGKSLEARETNLVEPLRRGKGMGL